jgi:transposase
MTYVDTMTSEKTATRRRYSAQLKAQVVAECDAPGASVAKVAMSRGINANVVHGWRKRAREGGVALVAPQRAFVPVALEAAPMPTMPTACPRAIEVELRRGGMTMKITWPPEATADFTAWSRELLR